MSLYDVPKEKRKEVYKKLVMAYIRRHKDAVEYLREIVEYEMKHGKNGRVAYWRWFDVGIHWKILDAMAEAGILMRVSGDRKGRWYRLYDLEVVAEVLRELGVAPGYKPQSRQFGKLKLWEKPFPIPDDPKKAMEEIFPHIVGYEKVKRLFVMALRSRAPVHVLLVGPPGIGKTIFLEAIEEYLSTKGACVVWVEGGESLTSSAGLKRLIIDHIPPDRPCVLLFDEIDKCPKKDYAILYHLMNPGKAGKIAETLATSIVREIRYVWVFATANDLEKIPEAIRSRFFRVKIREWTEKEWLERIPKILKHEVPDLPEELAHYIARKLLYLTRDPRDAIRVAIAARSKEDIDMMVELMYGEKATLLQQLEEEKE